MSQTYQSTFNVGDVVLEQCPNGVDFVVERVGSIALGGEIATGSPCSVVSSFFMIGLGHPLRRVSSDRLSPVRRGVDCGAILASACARLRRNAHAIARMALRSQLVSRTTSRDGKVFGSIEIDRSGRDGSGEWEVRVCDEDGRVLALERSPYIGSAMMAAEAALEQPAV